MTAAPPAPGWIPPPRGIHPQPDAPAVPRGDAGRVTPPRPAPPTPAATAPGGDRPSRALPPAALAVVGGVAGGALTSLGQTYLPEALRPLANCSGTWCALAAGLALPARRPVHGALLAPLALVGLVVGYYAASAARGFPVSPASVGFWLALAVVVGPVLGAGAVLARRGAPLPAAVGTAPLAGILLGESWYGLTVVAGTTSPVAWALEGLAAVALVAVVVVRRLRVPVPVLLCVALTAAVAVAFRLAYAAL